MAVFWVVGCFVAGVVVGLVGRVLLGRLSRGVVLRPPWCELVAGLLSGLAGWRVAAGLLPVWWLPVPLLLGWLAVPLASVDLARSRLPDSLTLPAYPLLGLAVGTAAVLGSSPGLGLRAVTGVLVFGGVHLLCYLASPRALGAGDVKLAGSLGAVLGAVGWAALVVGALLAAVITLCVSLARRVRSVPHGPGLLAATWLVAAFGHR
ncbi:MAG TPA: A24 family peptidase [Pseudonocardiaceae bacterium]|jgi:leader peptidase (prepilin peptidase)/N-methyltransferase|nr:A24 family peptidase [Pseudonocardiaceae bacterium]